MNLHPKISVLSASNFIKAVALLFMFIILNSCERNKNPISTEVEQPKWRDVAMQHSMDADTLQKGFEVAEAKEWIYSILIMRHDTLIAEKYFYQDNYDWRFYSREHPEDVATDFRCAVHSITSILIGIAIDQGYIKSINEKMMDFFPEYKNDIQDQRKFDITIKHLLTMISGYGEDNWPSISIKPPMNRILLRPLSLTPGNFGNTVLYDVSCDNILNGILRKTINMSCLDFAYKYLFNPLGISSDLWINNIDGTNIGCLYTPRDMLKIGQLYENNGVFNGKQVVSSEWVNVSTRNYQPYTWGAQYPPYGLSRKGFGYIWYTGNFDQYSSFYAGGHWGQFLWVIPELELVLVSTGYAPNEEVMCYFSLWLKRYVLGSLIN